MGDAPFNQFAAPSPSEGVGNAAPPVIPASQGQAPGNSGQASNGSTAQNIGQDWRLPGLEKFQAPQDVGKAYLEAQKTLSQAQNDVHRYRQFVEQIQPFLPLLDQLAAQMNGEGQPGHNTGQGRKGAADPEMAQMIEQLQAKVTQSEERQRGFAISTATKSFKGDHPEAEQYFDELSRLIADPKSPIAINDFTDPDELYKALETALGVVMASKMQKQQAGRQAAGVAGGSLGQKTNTINPFDPNVSREDIMKQIQELTGQQ